MSLPWSLVLPHSQTKSRAKIVNQKAWVFYTVCLLTAIFLNRGVRARFPGILGFASNISSSDIISLTNQARQNNGLSGLKYNEALSRAAEEKAHHMFNHDYWAHVAPDGTDPWYFIKAQNYDYIFAGENLARDFNDSHGVLDAWLASPSHRDNVLSGRYSEIGIAVVDGVLDGEQTTLVVQMFGAPVQIASVLPSESAVAISREHSSVAVPSPIVQPKAYPVKVSGPSAESAPFSKQDQSLNIVYDFLTSSGYVLTSSHQSSTRFLNFSLLTKFSSLIFVVFASGGFFLDALVARHWGIRRLSGHTLAHFGLLTIVLVALYYTSAGMIL
ncbi:hypothetical protein COT52_02780 [candidate division WWE3 bacterium CG08_land_8_20_14_0_20_43_13]|uniref:SCP domain-containing protein n=1 Tax=candidate division WWE3 bacterium CG08_land_8_20_14_0_20_43_13 TaxID=1975087 RepID=A0A2H0X975_UNCKA|nr:MAG: hypothetical protein COT52_02780 [candidate division WWE3 bacterium CG08_land_8_20_14_0_20_43_13]